MQSSRQKAAGDAGAVWEDYDRNDAVQDQESRLSPGRERETGAGARCVCAGGAVGRKGVADTFCRQGSSC